jgi:hypothetical protein
VVVVALAKVEMAAVAVWVAVAVVLLMTTQKSLVPVAQGFMMEKQVQQERMEVAEMEGQTLVAVAVAVAMRSAKEATAVQEL